MNLNLNLNLNRYLRPDQIDKLTTLVNTTLGRFSSNIFGPHFSIHRPNETEIVAQIPITNLNKDSQNEIQIGQVVNTGLAMGQWFLNEQLGGPSYRMTQFDINMDKKLNWNTNLILKMQTDLEAFELKIIEFQKYKKFTFEFVIHISNSGSKKKDKLAFKIEVQKINLLT